MEDSNVDKELKGLGDAIARLTHYTGIAKLVEEVTKAVGIEDCGCERRKEILNDLVPFKKEDKKDQE